MTRDTRTQPPELAATRERLGGLRGRQLWRALDELAEGGELAAYLRREFPSGAEQWGDPLSRRAFLKMMGASLALAGLAACGRPREQIVPYVTQPPEIVSGKPLFYATALTLGGLASGVLAESHMGRPVKIEGNPRHPASLGASDAFMQAAILSLYDPDRSQAVLNLGRISTWDRFLTDLGGQMSALGARGGAGLRLLTEPISSPALADQIAALLAQYPRARWHQYVPVARDSAFEGARMAFGQPASTIYRFDLAARIVSLDADFLSCSAGSLRYARDFAAGRRVSSGGDAAMNRLYAIESAPSITGAMADHRLAVRPSQVAALARELARRLGLDVAPAPGAAPAPSGWLDALARDLQANRGASIVVAGDEQPPEVHALAHAMNAALGNAGATVLYLPPVEASPANAAESLRALAADMAAGQVSALVIFGCNPAYDAPADLSFATALAQVPFRVHMGLYDDETARLCDWHIPAAHAFEDWGDARAFDGSVSIAQPLIAPLYGGRSAHELLAAMQGQLDQSSYAIVRGFWQRQHAGADFEQFWRRALHDGVVEGTAFAPIELAANLAGLPAPAQAAPAGGLELRFQPDPAVYDGRFANNGWLQELPRPLSSLTWGNAALISPATAARLGLAQGDVAELRYRGRSVRAPVLPLPGHPDDAVTVTLGYGRARAGHIGTDVGFDAYALRTADAPWFGAGLELAATGAREQLALTQSHFGLEGRELLRVGTLDEYAHNPRFASQPPGTDADHPPSLYPEVPYTGHRWGMAIDLNSCIGCQACTVACQAENNIPVVGKEQVLMSREMHWLKVDRYYEGDAASPNTYFQPRPCMQCEKAPCELVCPVAATAHSAEGLNDMVYNRCVGTRYCSNNCPYKVRRFNFLQYSHTSTPVIKLHYNPDVTVRDRGVMEKCTYCVQRINAGRIEAEKAGRPIRDGEIKTACQQACPTEAIVFGDINDVGSQVARLKESPLSYGMLAELGTQPRTTYLARLRNPNPEL